MTQRWDPLLCTKPLSSFTSYSAMSSFASLQEQNFSCLADQCSTVQSKSSDPLSKLLQQNTGHYKDTPILSIFDLWQLTLSFWLSLDAFTTKRW